VPVYTHCYPNAGLPNALGEYDHTPDIMAGHLERFAERGWLNLVGGCCGSTPGHIRAIARAVEGKKPRVPPPPVRVTRLSGLEPLTVTPDVRFVAVGERTNVTGSRRFARLIRTGDDEAALEAACLQVEQGARVIDVNMDEGMLDSRKSMVRFLNLLASNPRAARVPVMVDSSDWSVIRAGLKCLPGKGIVNSISLKDGEAPFREHAREARSLGAAVVVMAFDEQGQAGTAERKLEICERSYRILVGELEFPPEDILFDLNVFAVATGMPEHDRLALHFIEAAREVKRRFPHSHVSGGLSNLSFSFRGNDRVREAMHAVFLEHAVPAGMDFAIVNPGRLPDPETIPESLRSRVRDVILAARGDAAERLLELAQTLHAGPSGEPEAPPSRESDVFARLCGAIVKGSARNLEADLAEALGRDASPVAIIEGPLLNGMREVGERFGAGRMFLPQVVQSARVMKRAVEILAPRLEKKTRSRVPAASRGRIVLATVKGDVHDIGKNIVETVLACNGYDVINLGERIPPEKIIEAAKDSGADMVGLSGLITPSLEEMCTVARAMKKSGMALPLLIGGAAASAVHTAVKIAPCYGGPVLYIRDASEAVGVVADLADPARKEKRLAETRALFERLVRRHEVKKRSAACLPLEQARRRRARPDTGGVRPLRPGRSAVRAFANEDWDGLRERIDWNDVFRAWGVSGKTGNGRENDERSRMAREIRERGERYLDIALSGSRVDIAAVSGLFYAESLNEDIVLFHDPGGTKRAGVVPTLRRQAGEGEKYCPALSDFILPAGSKTRDVLGVFVVTCRAGASGAIPREDRENDDRGIWERVILNALAEAASRRLHERMSREIDPGLAPGAVSGIRPAPGYPVLPDHAVKRILLSLLRADERIGVTLTENDMMIPESSVCGLYLFHPEARYFNVGWIGRDQVADYAARIGEDVETVEKRLAGNLGYKPD
jgi:5-methyltetrahydrofolate--homocysteine methyltransferase